MVPGTSWPGRPDVAHLLSASPSPRLRGEGRGEGLPSTGGVNAIPRSRLLISGIVPGILTALIYCVGIYIIARWWLKLASLANMTITWVDRWKSLYGVSGIAILFLLVVGGAISMAAMLKRSARPSLVPQVIASMLLASMLGSASSPPVAGSCGGTSMTAKTIGAGALMKEAARMWPSAPGIRSPGIPAYSAVTMPADRTMNNSPRETRAR